MTRSIWIGLIVLHALLIAGAIVLAKTETGGMLPVVLAYGASMGVLSLIMAWAERLPDHLSEYSDK